MILRVDARGAVSLEEVDDFKGFHIERAETTLLAGTPFAQMSKPAEEGRVWLDAVQLVAISGRSKDTDWTTKFWNMLSQAEKFGFADLEKKRVKAHFA